MISTTLNVECDWKMYEPGAKCPTTGSFVDTRTGEYDTLTPAGNQLQMAGWKQPLSDLRGVTVEHKGRVFCPVHAEMFKQNGGEI